MMRDHLRFYLNGRPQTVGGDAAFASLTDYLRGPLGLVGTKVVCAEGDCGACTVLVGRPHGDSLRYLPVDSCIQFLYQLDGTHVITIEGMSTNGDLHPVQRAMIDCHGSQCGYCTPGFVMALAGWAEAGCREDRRLALTGNLCRCTGYVPILDASDAIANEPPESVSSRYDTPALIADLKQCAEQPLGVTDGRRSFAAQTKLADAVAFKVAHPTAVIVAGGTELGVLRNRAATTPVQS